MTSNGILPYSKFSVLFAVVLIIREDSSYDRQKQIHTSLNGMSPSNLASHSSGNS